jgi:GNAT superfamily N-acetyltransferase
MTDMQLRSAGLGDPAVRRLLEGLEEEYERRYGPGDEMRRTREEDFDPPAGLFLVVLDGPVTAAGGGYRFHTAGVCEVKRMWTDPAYRRRGLAWQVLGALEEKAADAGYHRLVLETGPLQPEAAALYERRGYRRTPVFGPYPQALAFETDLAALAEDASRI